MKTLINGQYSEQGEPSNASVSVFDRGLHYGDGLFETIAIIKGQSPLWDYHVQRLSVGCQRLDIHCPEASLLLQEALQLCADEEKAVLKIMLTRGEGGRGYRYPETLKATRILICYPWPDYAESNWHTGVDVTVCQTPLARQPRLAGIKHLNRLEQVLARNEWQADEYIEGLMLDTDGGLIEGTFSNLFLVRAGQLFTASLDHAGVAGVMREYIMKRAKSLAIDVNICQLRLEDALDADEVFICNSLIGIWPVKRLDSVEKFIGPITKQLQQQVQPIFS